jgi:hypothetical protein
MPWRDTTRRRARQLGYCPVVIDLQLSKPAGQTHRGYSRELAVGPVRERLHDVPQHWPPMGIIGLGRSLFAPISRVPMPPQRIITFIEGVLDYR